MGKNYFSWILQWIIYMFVTSELNVNKQLAIEWAKRGDLVNIDHERNNPDVIKSNNLPFLSTL